MANSGVPASGVLASFAPLVMNDTPPPDGNTSRPSWVRALRPFLWWGLLVVLVFGYQTHRRLSQKTRLSFSVSLQGLSISSATDARCDGRPVLSGERISLGRHELIVSHPQAEPFSTNLFIWYGVNDLGRIALQRSRGNLLVEAVPPAAVLSIRGPEFQTSLTNSAGLTSAVPTDAYVIQAQYAYWQGRQETTVGASLPGLVRFAPKLGAMRIESTQVGTSFSLNNSEGRRVETGATPALIAGLPEGTYQVISLFHEDRRESASAVKAGETNVVRFEFMYGAAVIESQPPGATVTAGNGRQYGVTPLTLSELEPGKWTFTLRLDGYVPVEIPVAIAANATNTIRTNLVNATYARAMETARRELAKTNLQAALVATGEALDAQPGDAEALALQVKATLGKAQMAAKAGRTQEALAFIAGVLRMMPENAEAKQLEKDLLQQEQAKVEDGERAEAAAKRERRPKEYFGEQMKKTPFSSLFDQQEMKVKGNLYEVEAKLVSALTNDKPAFKLTLLEHPETDLFRFRTMQNLGSAGWRRCDLVGGQTSDGEVTLVFKVFEYAYVEALSLRALLGDNAERNMVPIHPSRLAPQKSYLLPRREEGIRLIRERIRKVVDDQ